MLSTSTKAKKRAESVDVTISSEPTPMELDESVVVKKVVDKWTNFTRVLPEQLKFIKLGNQRYQPVKVIFDCVYCFW